ncbi:MAG: hypothetical protein KF908_03705 [Nitrosomonas sp.]|nr:hypothetical protein [Nitrosomonas sp.]MCW5607724.1 hypothetical protein [Nitrosomonas sp.]
MAFWSTQTLKKRLPALIDPCDETKIKEASYELKIGSEIYISKDYHDNNSQHTKRILTNNEPFTIPPGQFAFLLTEECVSVPNDAIAFISMKASSKYKGLVNISGFHVDPGYKGKLLFSVHNAGPSTIHLQQNAPIFLIWYASLDQEDSIPKNKEGLTEIPSKVLNELSTETIYSMQTLTSRMSNIEHEHTSIISSLQAREKFEEKLEIKIRWAIGIAVTVIIGFAAIFFSNTGKHENVIEDSRITQLVEEQRKLLQELKRIKFEELVNNENVQLDDKKE